MQENDLVADWSQRKKTFESRFTLGKIQVIISVLLILILAHADTYSEKWYYFPKTVISKSRQALREMQIDVKR